MFSRFFVKDNCFFLASFLLDPRISRQVSQTLAQNVIEVHKSSTMTTNSGGISAGGATAQNTMTCNNNTANEIHNSMDNAVKNPESTTAKSMQKDLKTPESDEIR